jgi:chemotaxis protein CheD
MKPNPQHDTEQSHPAYDVSRGERRFYFDIQLNALVVSVCQGHFYVSSSPYEVLSCIAVCMRDPIAGCGGMNHFLLPSARDVDQSDGLPSASLRYGSYSIERLTNALISRGAIRERLEVKVFGGANVLSSGGNVGHTNADFVEAYLQRERLTVVASSLRGTSARRVRYYPATGRAQMSEVSGEAPAEIALGERSLAAHLDYAEAPTRVEIFANPRRRK